ncbi:MAG: hypothetical protein GXY48_06705 [Methanomicrobiales archaeon]|nr:hypothetical protein [Methanomicrobiales archaeon]
MKIREKIIDELDKLSPTEYLSVYEYIWSIKSHHKRPMKKPREHYYNEVRGVLQFVEGDLSNDIICDREERI